jgi:hypothetical protein
MTVLRVVCCSSTQSFTLKFLLILANSLSLSLCLHLIPTVQGDFNDVLFLPSLTSEEEFVLGLEGYTMNHRAVTHHLLSNLACVSFGKKTDDMLLMFLSACSHFNSGFIGNVKTLMGLLDNQDHVETLGENLREEMGEYNEGTLLACEAMGIRSESVRGVPHQDRFKGLVEFLETVLQRSYSRLIPRDICKKLNQAIDYARGCG